MHGTTNALKKKLPPKQGPPNLRMQPGKGEFFGATDPIPETSQTATSTLGEADDGYGNPSSDADADDVATRGRKARFALAMNKLRSRKKKA